MPVAYKTRTDEVLFEQFDGTVESAQRIANLIRGSVYLIVRENQSHLDGDPVNTVVEFNSGRKAHNDEYVTVYQDESGKDRVNVMSADQFERSLTLAKR